MKNNVNGKPKRGLMYRLGELVAILLAGIFYCIIIGAFLAVAIGIWQLVKFAMGI